MKRSIINLAILVMLLSLPASAQPPHMKWMNIYIDGYMSGLASVQQTNDGGFIAVGSNIQYGFLYPDVYLVKTDEYGDTIWTCTYAGGDLYDYGFEVKQTDDGGYIVVGITKPIGQENGDIFLLRIHSCGFPLWGRNYGGDEGDFGNSVDPTLDGGFIVTGSTHINDNMYIFLMKTDGNGDTLWTKTYTDGLGSGRSVIQLQDGNYIVAGITWTYGAGSGDVYLIKVDQNGDTIWTHTYGGPWTDVAHSVKQTMDGGFIIVGYTDSFGPPWTTGVYLIKTDAEGDTLWTRNYEGADDYYGNSVDQTTDGGYIIAGRIGFGATSGYALLIRTDANGDTLWTYIYDEECDWGEAHSVQQTSDGGFIITGSIGEVEYPNYANAFLICLEGARLNVTLTSHNPPIIIPPGGGSFVFDVSIENVIGIPVDFDTWTEAVLPDCSVFGPILLRTGLTIPPGAVIERELTQWVPAGAPVGDYIYIGNVGMYPDSIIDSDEFEFEKLAGEGAPVHNFGWEIYGWEGEEAPVISAPTEFVLHPSYPNPFNAETNLTFDLPEAGDVSLVVYDVQGREVVRLVDGFYPAGSYEWKFSPLGLSSGVYFAKLEAGDLQQTRKMLLVR